MVARRGAITITFGAPVLPVADTLDAFAAAVVLRDAARAHPGAYCAPLWRAGQPMRTASGILLGAFAVGFEGR
jgi:hypothetical protein